MWSAQTILPAGERPGPLAALSSKFASYALAGIARYHGRKLVGHTGGVAGFVSRVMLVPEENLGVVILTNAKRAARLIRFFSICWILLWCFVHGLDCGFQGRQG